MCVTKKPYNSHPDNKGSYPANTRHSPNAVSMLAHRLRRWSNIETALGECLTFAGYLSSDRKEPCIPRHAGKSVIKTLSSCGKPVAIHLTFSARADVSCLYMSHAKIPCDFVFVFFTLNSLFSLFNSRLKNGFCEWNACLFTKSCKYLFSFTYLNLSFSVERQTLWSEGIS